MKYETERETSISPSFANWGFCMKFALITVILHTSSFILSAAAQNISVTLTDPHRGLLHLDSANWNEAWVELDGASPLAKQLTVSDFLVTSGEQTATVLSVDSVRSHASSHLALSFVLDNSGSMFHAYDSITRMCDTLLDSLPAGVIAQCVTFDKEPRSPSHLYTKRASTYIAPSGFRDSLRAISRFWHFFDTIRTTYTPLYDAIVGAIGNITARVLTDSTGKREDVVIVITDGADNASRANIETLADLAAASRVRLIAINFRSEVDTRLVWLARHTMGAYFLADDVADLRELLRRIGLRLTREYHITYQFHELGPIRRR